MKNLRLLRKICRKGFTLVEMLMGLTLFTLVALSIYSIYSQGMRIQRAAEESGAIVGQLRWAFDVLTRDLENAVPWSATGESGKLVEWKNEEITFLTATAQGLQRIRYSLKLPEETRIHQVIVNRDTVSPKQIIAYSESGTKRGAFLMRQIQPLTEGEKLAAGSSVDEEVLIANVVSGSLSFSFAKAEDQNGEKTVSWLPNWASAHPPRGIRVEMELLNPDENQPVLAWRKDIFLPAGELTQ